MVENTDSSHSTNIDLDVVFKTLFQCPVFRTIYICFAYKRAIQQVQTVNTQISWASSRSSSVQPQSVNLRNINLDKC